MAPTMINPASSWFEIAELPVVEQLHWQTVNGKELLIADEICDKTSERIAKLVNKPGCVDIHGVVTWYTTIEVSLNFTVNTMWSYGITCKPTMVKIKNPWANNILERVRQVLGQMLCTAKLDMANSFTPDDVNVFLDNAAWAICSTYHMVLKASPGAAIFGQDMLFDILFVAEWHKIG